MVTWQIFLQINFRVKIDVLEQTGIIFFQTDLEAILFLQNVIEVAFAAGVEPALNSMIADRSRGHEDIRGDGFAALGVIMHLSDAWKRYNLVVWFLC